MIEDEQNHYRELSGLIRRQKPRGAPSALAADPKTQLEQMLAKRNKGRAHTAGWIGDAIYGVNDGLGSIFGIVSGVSGATLGDSKWVLLSGIAGMIASALSMGSGGLPGGEKRARDLRSRAGSGTRSHCHERRRGT